MGPEGPRRQAWLTAPGPRLVYNTLVTTYRPAERWETRDELNRLRLRGMLPVGWRLVRSLDRFGSTGSYPQLQNWYLPACRRFLNLLVPAPTTPR